MRSSLGLTPFILLSFLVLSSLNAGCFGKNSEKASIRTVEAQEAFGQLKNDFAVLLDVREETEIKGGMASMAQSIPYSKIENNDSVWQDFLKNTPKGKQVIVYCNQGVRSKKVGERLAAFGFQVLDLGTYQKWVDSKLPTRKGP